MSDTKRRVKEDIIGTLANSKARTPNRVTLHMNEQIEWSGLSSSKKVCVRYHGKLYTILKEDWETKTVDWGERDHRF